MNLRIAKKIVARAFDRSRFQLPLPAHAVYSGAQLVRALALVNRRRRRAPPSPAARRALEQGLQAARARRYSVLDLDSLELTT
jgi:hypothetical protein